MDFSTLPVDALHRYLAQYGLIPAVHPSPLSGRDPPPPLSLLGLAPRGSSRGASPPPPAVTTPANRPRRESREQSRRRSSRLLEEEGRARTPVLADIAEVQTVLARIAQRHFEGQVVKEVDSLASFMCAVKGRGTVCSPGFYERLVLYITRQPSLLDFGRRCFGALL
jgi:Sin3 binding region of histone deacetylase complex subunit SAP30